MSTAIVVSGLVRHIANAMGSWRFDGDYYLVTDDNVYNPHSRDIVGSAVATLSDTLLQSSIKFKGVYLQLDESVRIDPKYLALDPSLPSHPVVAMVWKWRCAYNLIKQQGKVYDRVLLLRPDLYIWYIQPESAFNNFHPAPSTIHGTKGMFHDDQQNRPTMGDVFLLFDMQVFEILAGFFDYFMANYDLMLHHRYDLHTLLAKYVIENNLVTDDKLLQYCLFTVLRSNSEHMFEHSRLKPHHSFIELQQKQTQWWNERYNVD
jgi:hypothetical protein